MDFVSNKKTQIAAMLKVVGVSSVEELFSAIPSSLLQKAPSKDDGLSEAELLRHFESLSFKNTAQQFSSFLGAGAYDHHIPACVGAICQKSEFLTAYTPYQAEISQGSLEAIFEFQSCISALTGMDVSNASLYDGASACAESLLMALRLTKKNRVCISNGLHPNYLAVCKQYLAGNDFEIVHELDEQCGAFLLQSPNFFGNIEQCRALFAKAEQHNAVGILCANPLSYGLFPSAAELGASIAVGDTQVFGLPLSYGGPYCGYIACKAGFERQMPGRIVGKTKDSDGKEGFVLTLQAREQHIRREKATSNICTNQALAALASTITILWLGPKGMRELALCNYQRAHYLHSRLKETFAVTADPFFNEFVLTVRDAQTFLQKMEKRGILAGHFLTDRDILVAVTEKKTKKDLDAYVEAAV